MQGLEEHEIEVLDQWLGQNSEQLPSVEAIDGFFTALLISPQIPAEQEWQQVLFGSSTPESIAEVMPLIERHWDELSHLIGPAAEADDLEEWAPIIFDVNEGISDETLDTGYGQHWAFGFHVGINSVPHALKALGLDQSEKPAIDESEFNPITLLTALILLEEGAYPDQPEEKLSLAELRAIEAELGDCVMGLRYHFAEYRRENRLGTLVKTVDKIGRNDDCGCGSGKKFKKCCGAN